MQLVNCAIRCLKSCHKNFGMSRTTLKQLLVKVFAVVELPRLVAHMHVTPARQVSYGSLAGCELRSIVIGLTVYWYRLYGSFETRD